MKLFKKIFHIIREKISRRKRNKILQGDMVYIRVCSHVGSSYLSNKYKRGGEQK